MIASYVPRLPDPVVDNAPELEEFRCYDADGDGMVTVDEFCRLLGSIGSPLSLAQRCEAFDRIDRDRDGRVSGEEYVWWHRG